MSERPDLTDRDLARALRTQFAIDATSIELLDLGQDARAWCYRVEARGARYFVKVRAAQNARDVAASVSRHLHEAGIPHVVAPLRSPAGSLTVREGDHSLIVYPLIDGATGMQSTLTERHWRMLGSFLKRVHASSLPSDLTELAATESYRPAELDLIPRIDRAVSRRSADDLAAFWTAHRDEILALAARTEALGRELERLALPLVLCHADLHTNNVMIDRDGELWVIDWDEPTRAPKERDLMFVVGGIRAGLVEPHETAWFLEGYGEIDLHPLALSYYRHAWAVQDIGSYGEQVFLESALGTKSRASAAFGFKRLFEPGAIVEIARSGRASSDAAVSRDP